MPNAVALIVGLARRSSLVPAKLLVMLLLGWGAASPAKAQDFRFDWSGTLASQSLVISFLFNATNLVGNQYRIDSITSGTVVDNTPAGPDLNGNITGISTVNHGVRSVRNEFFFPHNGTPGILYEPLTSTETGGFRIISSSGHDYLTFTASTNASNGVAIFSTGSTSAASSTSGGTQTITQVPGPLAGAGLLSYLAAMLMGLAWLRQTKRGRKPGHYKSTAQAGPQPVTD